MGVDVKRELVCGSVRLRRRGVAAAARHANLQPRAPTPDPHVVAVDSKRQRAQPDHEHAEQDQRDRPADRVGEMLSGEPSRVGENRERGDEQEHPAVQGHAQVDHAGGDGDEGDLEHRAVHDVEKAVEKADGAEQVDRRRDLPVAAAIHADSGQQQAAAEHERRELLVDIEQIEGRPPEERGEEDRQQERRRSPQRGEGRAELRGHHARRDETGPAPVAARPELVEGDQHAGRLERRGDQEERRRRLGEARRHAPRASPARTP